MKESQQETSLFTSICDISYARNVLETTATTSSGNAKTNAYIQLIRCTELSRSGRKETLIFLNRLIKESDSMRHKILLELAKCKVNIITESEIEPFMSLIEGVLKLTDTSNDTYKVLQILFFRIITQYAATPQNVLFRYAILMLLKLPLPTGQITFPSMNCDIPHGAEKNVFEGIYPFLIKEYPSKKEWMIRQMAIALGKRGYELEKLQELLQVSMDRMAYSERQDCIKSWLGSKKTRDARVRALINKDFDYIKNPYVFRHIYRKRQEWMNPYISKGLNRDWFLVSYSSYALPAERGFTRWLPRQQRLFGNSMVKVPFLREREIYQRITSIKNMASMPDGNQEEVLQFLYSEEPSIAEAAIDAVSLLQEPEQSVSLLLEQLYGNSGRKAMGAIQRCGNLISPEFMAVRLKELLQRDNLNVTVRAEAIHLIGSYRFTNCLDLLSTELQKENPHKDVLKAVGYAARQMLDHEKSWAVLDQLASCSEYDVLRSLLQQKPDSLSVEQIDRYLKLIVKIMDGEDFIIKVDGMRRMIRWIPNHESMVARAAVAMITDFAPYYVYNYAILILVECCCTTEVNEMVVAMVEQLIYGDYSAQSTPAIQKDLLNRQRLKEFVSNLIEKYGYQPELPRLLFEEIIQCLRKEPTLTRMRMDLELVSIDWSQESGFEAVFGDMVQAMKENPYLIYYGYEEIMKTLRKCRDQWNVEMLLKIIASRYEEGDSEATFLSLALVERIYRDFSWQEDGMEWLKKYREHENVMVRSKAMEIWKK